MAGRNIRHDRAPARARLAARHAERLYPGPLGRLVAHELRAYAEVAQHAEGDLAEHVVAEILHRMPPAAALLPSGESSRGSRRAS